MICRATTPHTAHTWRSAARSWVWAACSSRSSPQRSGRGVRARRSRRRRRRGAPRCRGRHHGRPQQRRRLQPARRDRRRPERHRLRRCRRCTSTAPNSASAAERRCSCSASRWPASATGRCRVGWPGPVCVLGLAQFAPSPYGFFASMILLLWVAVAGVTLAARPDPVPARAAVVPAAGRLSRYPPPAVAPGMPGDDGRRGRVRGAPRLGRPRGVAQLGSAPALGAGGRGFKSRHPDFEACWAHIPAPRRLAPSRLVEQPRAVHARRRLSVRNPRSTAAVKSTIEELGPTRVRMAIEVPWGDLDHAFGEVYKELGKQVRVPGFRPGKVPEPRARPADRPPRRPGAGRPARRSRRSTPRSSARTRCACSASPRSR